MNRREALAEGYVCYCLQCRVAFKKVPVEDYEDGHGGRKIPMCRCGCDLLASMAHDGPISEEDL